MHRVLCAVVVILGFFASSALADDSDPFLWLEDVTGEKALSWVRKHNEKCTHQQYLR